MHGVHGVHGVNDVQDVHDVNDVHDVHDVHDVQGCIVVAACAASIGASRIPPQRLRFDDMLTTCARHAEKRADA